MSRTHRAGKGMIDGTGTEFGAWLTIIAGLSIIALAICILIWGANPLGWFGQPLPQ